MVKAKKKLISVIICFLNAKKFLREAVQSVFTQTYDNWELLLIDDGSTDNSRDFAQHYAKQHPQKIYYIDHNNHKNRGLAISRNTGISASKGEYIAFLDADDTWLPKKLEQQVAIMNNHPKVAMAYGPALHWYSWTGKPEDKKRDYVQWLKIKQEEYNTILKPPNLLKKWITHMGVEPSPSGLIARRKAIEQVGDFEESFPTMLEDQAFYCKIFVNEPVFIASRVWWNYRQHPDSICNSVDKKEHCAISLRFWEWVKRYLENKGIEDIEMRSVLEKRIRDRRLGRL